MLYDAVADLSVTIDEFEFTRQARETTSGFTRATTTVSLHGDGESGHGEDVTYDSEMHDALAEASPDFPVTGEFTIEEFSNQLGDLDLFLGETPEQAVARNYRQWAFESAALDLGLKQADTDLAAQLGRPYQPVRFVVSTRLAEPPTGDRVLKWLDRNPALEFKLDPTPDWTGEVIDRIAATDAARVLDLKGQYHGTTVDQPADPALYEQVLAAFPEAIIEDPGLTEETRPLFDDHQARVAWDHPIQSVDSIKDLPWAPSWLNIKPSRFGSVQSLFSSLEYCLDHDISLYGGGQFELDVGREHLHALASLFYPDGPNDVAPKGYNDPEPPAELPTSPLAPPTSPRGFEWAN